VFLTNDFELSALTIVQIYKARWQIEIFFKWNKQHLKIKSFLGTSKNDVLSQIWIAMCYYLILTYIKYQTKYQHSLLKLTRLFRETLFDKINIIVLLSLEFKRLDKLKQYESELSLF